MEPHEGSFSRRRALALGAAAGVAGAVGWTRQVGASTVPAPSAPSFVPPTGTASIETPAGTFEIPLDPQRVLAIEPRFDVERAIVLQYPLVAIGGNNAEMRGTPVAPWVPNVPTDIPLLTGTVENLEAMADLDPDLIVTTIGDETERLAEIAPLLAQDWNQSWRDMLVEVGEWTQRSELTDAVIAEYDAAVADLLDRYGDVVASATVAVIQPTNQAAFNTMGIPSPLVHLQVLEDIGGTLLPFAAEQNWADGVSVELVSELDAADGLFVLANLGSGGTLQLTEQQILDDPLYGAVPAITGGHAQFVDWRVNFGLVYTALECVRQWDALYAKLAGEPASTTTGG